MKIIESSIIGKKSSEACEDGMVVTDDFIAVIDGSTSKTSKHLNPDMKNGRYAMMLISQAEPDLYGYRWIPGLSGGSKDCSVENEACFK